jgi:catechol 2,3-dioxygenase-like lactoylglutathione lyase family enzyme
MLSYVYFGTNNFQKAVAFYSAILTPLGMERCITGDPQWDRIAAGWGICKDCGTRDVGFWIGKPFDQKPASAGNGSMVAFSAGSWRSVDDFHAAALANDGVCDGAPGLRLRYAPDFYAAYVRDPDGNKVAAVCRGFTRGESQPALPQARQ